MAKGDWIAFLDSDDEWIDTHLFNFVKTYNLYPSIKWYGAPFKMLDEITKREVFKVKKGHLKKTDKHKMFDDYMKAFPPKAYLSTPTMVIHKAVFNEVGYFDVSKKTAEDIDLWFRIGLVFPKIGYTFNEGAIVYKRKGSLSNSEKRAPLFAINRFKASEKLARDISNETLNRVEPRVMYWLVKLLRSCIITKDIEALKEIKKNYFGRLTIKYKAVLLLGIKAPFLYNLVKK